MATNLHHVQELLLFLLLLVALFAGMAKWLRVPYPILLVLAGLLISFVPRMPRVPLSPDMVFLVFLPPLLYAAAWQTNWTQFRANLIPISMLAIGLVGFTVLGVALFADHFMTALDFKSGFVLGAVVATTDAIAAAAIAKTVGLPARVMSILEGESLVNDATGLLALEFGLTLLRGDSPTLWGGTERLLWLAAGGIGIGLLLAGLNILVERYVDDGPISMAISLVVPYAAYLLAEQVNASGVLAVVACGLFLSRRTSRLFSAATRLELTSTWKALDFILNGLVFVLIGLQLPYILTGISGMGSRWQLLGAGLAFSGVLIALRLLWIFPATQVANFVRTRLLRQQQVRPTAAEVFVVGWTGMRGVVALAAALSLPLTLGDGRPFEQRNLILFLTFTVILVTVVLQGLTLPGLIRALGLVGTGGNRTEEVRARQSMLVSAIKHLEGCQMKLRNEDDRHRFDDLLHRYKHRLQATDAALADGNEKGGESGPYRLRLDLARETLEVERQALLRLQETDEVDDEVARKLERELDLTEARLDAVG